MPGSPDQSDLYELLALQRTRFPGRSDHLVEAHLSQITEVGPMRPIQVLLLAFVLFTGIKVVQKYKQRGIHLFELIFWTLIWGGAAVTISFPETAQLLADLLGIGRGADLIIYTTLLVALYLIFRIHLTLDRIEQEITEIVRATALARLTAPKNQTSRDPE